MRPQGVSVHPRLRLVLDTNVWLDWLVFEDASIRSLGDAHATGAIEIVMNGACADELDRVLAYPLRKAGTALSLEAQPRDFYRRIARWFEGGAASTRALPKCSDPDDQKFLELARDCAADFLLTRDDALLQLGRRGRDAVPFRIVTSTQFAAHLQAG